jgi:hypothetical protein
MLSHPYLCVNCQRISSSVHPLQKIIKLYRRNQSGEKPNVKDTKRTQFFKRNSILEGIVQIEIM